MRPLGWRDRLLAPWNALAYGVRRRLRFSRGEPELTNESKSELFAHLDGEERRRAEARASELAQRYRLDPLHACSSRLDYRDNLYLLAALEQLLDGMTLPVRERVQAVDVGSKNFSYAFALERFWRLFAAGGAERQVTLEGVEIDGHGIYPDLHARCDWARAYARQTGNDAVRYRIADFTACDYRSLDAVTMLFPFLTERALVRWGLPRELYAPERLLAHAAAALRPGGWLVLLHQTEDEKDRLLELLRATDLEMMRACPLELRLVDYWEATLDRWAVLCVRSGASSGKNASDSAEASANSGA